MRDGQDPHELGLAEQPTRAAQLKIKAEPARVKFTARRWLTAEGTVPPSEAQHLISMFGILGCVITGTAAAVLTLRIAPGLTALAFAELMLALGGMLLITICGLIRMNRTEERIATDNGQKGRRKGSIVAD